MGKEPKEPIQFGIIRIKDISFVLHEERISPNPAKVIKIEFQNTFGYDLANNFINLTLRVYFHYEDEGPELPLMDTAVQNIFLVPNLSSYQLNDTALDLPIDFLKTLVSLTISHTRAITAKNLAGTAMQNLFLPVVNLDDVTKNFFPASYK
jgi:hypothetical protein